jgi:EAL domain-containing protein (putative c-di-GMP-specific phosphodiesterase class I)
MLLIASESLRGAQSLTDVVRELSFTVNFFQSPEKLAELMGGQSRRVVLLPESAISDTNIIALNDAVGRAPFAVIVAADRDTLRSSARAELVNALQEFENIEWLGSEYDFESLAAAARRCRRRMLKLSRTAIENAFTDTEFVLRYQPKVERGDCGEWVAKEAESLVRWRHPEHGLIGPLEFLPEIDAFGMTARLGEYVLRKTAAQVSAWREQGLTLNACINLAPSLLNDNSLGEFYELVVHEYGLVPGNFTFEIIEQDLRNPEAPHLKTLADMRERGFRLCLDDFRVAASSLSMFERLPFDEIKIHALALKRAQKDPVAMQVLAALTGLAHNLGMTVCAEGVEDDAMFEFLKTIECDKMQGFLISEAVLPNIIKQVYASKPSSEDAA